MVLMNSPSRPDPAEQFLRAEGCVFTRQPDGTTVVEGDINIAYRGLTELPDLSSVVVKGDFKCNDNRLASLKGAPKAVGGDFWCHYNFLTDLAGAPPSVGKNFWCHSNNLTSLAGAPAAISEYFYCHDNPLTSLEGAPQAFTQIVSDFGKFSSWDEVPENLRLSPQTRLRLEEERRSREEAAARDKAMENLKEAAARRPFRLKKPGPAP